MKTKKRVLSSRRRSAGLAFLVLTVALWAPVAPALQLGEVNLVTNPHGLAATPVGASQITFQSLTEVDPGETEEVAPWIPIVTVVACDLKINACNADAQTAWSDCRSGATCPTGEWADGGCCDAKLSEDLFQCLITCGLNGPDGDYGNCCEATTGGSPVP